MNPFKFTRLRRRLFIIFIVVFLVPPALVLSFFTLSGSLADAPILVQALLFVPSGVLFLFPIALVEIISRPMAGNIFRYGEVFAEPRGMLGWTIFILFYLSIAFLFSWPANLKKD